MSAIKLVKDMGLTPSIWSNNIRAINKWFDSIGLYDYINPNDICNSIELGQGNYDKPHPNFYLLALKRINKSPNETLFIDDELVNILAGLKCGIPSIQFSLEDSKTSLSLVTEEAVKILRRTK
jgi:FMN phosphatase YigB (HAD superfamily)